MPERGLKAASDGEQGSGAEAKRGRKLASESRATEIRARLIAWKQMPERRRVSLRSLAAELGTSHQILCAYLRGLEKWRGKDYERRAKAIRERAWTENRGTTPAEEAQAEALDRAAFHYKIGAMLDTSVRRYDKELPETEAGTLKAHKLRLVKILAQNGSTVAQRYSNSTKIICQQSSQALLSLLDMEVKALATPLKRSLMPSPERSRENLKKARAVWRAPRPWRSRAESRVIQLFTWQWHLGHGPFCWGRALARWLGVSHTYVQKLTRTLSRDENDFLRTVRCFGVPTVEGLRRAREESRQQRERGFLRRQPRWKRVEYKIGETVVRDFVPTKPNAATLVADNPCLSDAPGPTKSSKEHLDYNAMHMWHLRVNAEREEAASPSRPSGRMRWRPGMRFRP
jgi:hypothetical protein